MGYDFRLADKFWTISEGILSPKLAASHSFAERRDNIYELWPGQMVLGESFEYFQIPDNVLAICYGKSSYARCGVLLNMTPIEPGWCGHLTMSISNVSRTPVRLHAYEGIGQMVFYESNEVPLVTYATKQGKYQNAQGIMAARVED